MTIVEIFETLLEKLKVDFRNIDFEKERSERLWEYIKLCIGIETTIIDWRVENDPDCYPECDNIDWRIKNIFEITSELRNKCKDELLERDNGDFDGKGLKEDEYGGKLKDLIKKW
ncbi:MAG: hypothetical protein ACRCUM_01375 [Mycoplasmoidaceae bacterium]